MIFFGYASLALILISTTLQAMHRTTTPYSVKTTQDTSPKSHCAPLASPRRLAPLAPLPPYVVTSVRAKEPTSSYVKTTKDTPYYVKTTKDTPYYVKTTKDTPATPRSREANAATSSYALRASKDTTKDTSYYVKTTQDTSPRASKHLAHTAPADSMPLRSPRRMPNPEDAIARAKTDAQASAKGLAHRALEMITENPDDFDLMYEAFEYCLNECYETYYEDCIPHWRDIFTKDQRDLLFKTESLLRSRTLSPEKKKRITMQLRDKEDAFLYEQLESTLTTVDDHKEQLLQRLLAHPVFKE